MTRRTLVLATLALASITVAAQPAFATPIAGNSALAAATTLYDPYEHAYVAQTDGSIREIYFRNGTFVASDVIAYHPGVVAISAFSNVITYPGAGLRDRLHVIVGMANGDLYDVYYSPGLGVHEYLLSHIDTSTGATITALAAWSSDVTFQNVAILTSDGNLYQLSYSDVTAPAQPPTLVAPTTATAIAGYSEKIWMSGTTPILNHLLLLDTDLIDISWHNGDEPDLNNSMTTVTTLESGGPTFQGFLGIAGFANYFRVYNVIPLLPTFAPPASVGSLKLAATYTAPQTGARSAASVMSFGNVSLVQGVAITGYLDAKDDGVAHVLTLDINGSVVDQSTKINTSPLSTWLSFPLGKY